MKIGVNHRKLVNRLIDRLPPSWRPTAAYLDLAVVDHGFIRAIYGNRHLVANDVWRSSQPGPRVIRKLAERGFKSIVNLRGPSESGTYFLESTACAQHGLVLHDFVVGSRDVPKKQALRDALRLFDTMQRPVLMHCKSGADRVGLMSALYLAIHEGRPIDEAAGQLSLRYGHVRQAKTGILDFFLSSYAAQVAAAPMPFLEWVDTVYDPDAMRAEFRSGRWASILVDRVLRRE